MKKLAILGIDALDIRLLQRWKKELPHFQRLLETACIFPVQSTFPPDSDTAWVTVATGLNPAKHGVVHFVDPLEKSRQILHGGQQDLSQANGPSFWEIAAQNGVKTIVVFPHLANGEKAFPGILVIRDPHTGKIFSTPKQVLTRYPEPKLISGVQGFPQPGQRGLLQYLSRHLATAKADADFALGLFGEEEWELFFAYWSTLDAVSHFFWNYLENMPGDNEHDGQLSSAIPAAYHLFDQIVGQFLSRVSEDTALMILSDHGMDSRPPQLLNINEALRQAGFLFENQAAQKPSRLIDFGKRKMLSVVSNLRLGWWASQAMRVYPGATKLFTRPFSVDWDRTVACATDQSGVKAYPYGGVRITQERVNRREYIRIRSEIISSLKDAFSLPDGTSPLQVIAPREEIYQGPFIEKYPDIILEASTDYGIGWALHVPLITHNDSINLVPGCHHAQSATCIIRAPQQAPAGVVDLLDIAPSVLAYLGIHPDNEYQGRDILAGS